MLQALGCLPASPLNSVVIGVLHRERSILKYILKKPPPPLLLFIFATRRAADPSSAFLSRSAWLQVTLLSLCDLNLDLLGLSWECSQLRGWQNISSCVCSGGNISDFQKRVVLWTREPISKAEQFLNSCTSEFN